MRLAKETVQLQVREDAAVVAVIDRIAASEGLMRSDILRRALRRFVNSFLSDVPETRTEPQSDTADAAT